MHDRYDGVHEDAGRQRWIGGMLVAMVTAILGGGMAAIVGMHIEPQSIYVAEHAADAGRTTVRWFAPPPPAATPPAPSTP